MSTSRTATSSAAASGSFTLGDLKNGTTHGGHLLEACVRPTCELFLIESPATLQKFPDAESGLALLRL